MIYVDQLYDYDNFKNLLNQYLPLEKFVQENNFVRINDSIISCLANKNFLSAKQIIASILSPTDSPVQSLFEIDPNLVIQYKEQNKIEDEFYVFSGSKSAFAFNLGLQTLSPSVNQLIITVYEMLNSIKFLGSGKSSLVLIKPVSDLGLDFFKSVVASRIDFYNNPKNLKYVHKILQQDCAYYKDVIDSYEKENLQLKSSIKKLNHEQYLSTQMTWS